MKHSQKARLIVLGCMFAVGVISAIIIWKTHRPSPGKPFEQITMEQALAYMEYETGYILVDIGIPEAVLPGVFGVLVLPDQGQQIYLYGRDAKKADMAAHKLSELGYSNVSEIDDAVTAIH